MTPEQELELIAIEEEERRRAGQRAPVPAAAAAAPIPNRLREFLAAAGTAPAKAAASIADLVGLGVEELKKRPVKTVTGAGSGSSLIWLMDQYKKLGLSPKVDELRDQLAGRKLEGDLPTAVTQGAVGGLLFPGGPLINAAAGGAGAGGAEVAAQAGAPPIVQAGAGLLAGLGTGGVLVGGKALLTPRGPAKELGKALDSLTPRQRLETALDGMDPAKMAWQAAPEGTNLRTLGEKAAMQPTGTKIQAKLQQQRDVPTLQDDPAVHGSIKQFAGQHVALNPGSELKEVTGSFLAQIGALPYRGWQALRRTSPYQRAKQYDELLVKSLEDLIRTIKAKKQPLLPGAAGAAGAGVGSQMEVPQNE